VSAVRPAVDKKVGFLTVFVRMKHGKNFVFRIFRTVLLFFLALKEAVVGSVFNSGKERCFFGVLGGSFCLFFC
jgi:hypothetical protein